jgi:hypothetical protein
MRIKSYPRLSPKLTFRFDWAVRDYRLEGLVTRCCIRCLAIPDRGGDMSSTVLPDPGLPGGFALIYKPELTTHQEVL